MQDMECLRYKRINFTEFISVFNKLRVWLVLFFFVYAHTLKNYPFWHSLQLLNPIIISLAIKKKPQE